jgi:DNA-binding CsgD family transcriptional regulator
LLEEPDGAAWLVRMALAAGDRRRADQVVTCVEHLAAVNAGVASIEALATHARALRNHDVAGLLDAAARYRHAYAKASALEDAGVTFLEEGDPENGLRRLRDASTAYSAAGAVRDQARVHRRLAALRQRRRQARPTFGWASLTKTEMAVADLVAQGLTNPEVAGQMYISRHTVDFHLRQIFRKLGVRSRVEMTRLVLTHS